MHLFIAMGLEFHLIQVSRLSNLRRRRADSDLIINNQVLKQPILMHFCYSRTSNFTITLLEID